MPFSYPVLVATCLDADVVLEGHNFSLKIRVVFPCPALPQGST